MRANGPTSSPMTQHDDELRMSFGEHLEELRRVVLRSLIATGVMFLLCFGLLREPIMRAVIGPHAQVQAWWEAKERAAAARAHDAADEAEGNSPAASEVDGASPVRITNLQALTPQARFVAYLKVCLLAAFLMALPVVSYFVWSFVAAGLYEHERRYVRLVAPFSAALFLSGAAFAYYVLLPYALRFLLTYGDAPFDTCLDLTKYIGFFLSMELLMGIVFQIPLVSMFLQGAGILSADLLRTYRKHAVLVMCTLSAAFTPPDWVTMLVVVGPMMLLYELGIWIGKLRFGKGSETP